MPVPTRSPARAHSTTPRRLSPPCACTGWGTTHPPAHRPPASACHWLSHEMPRSTLEPPLLPLSGEKRPSKVSFTDGTQGQQRPRGLGLEQDCGTRSACNVPSGGPGLRVGRGSPPPLRALTGWATGGPQPHGGRRQKCPCREGRGPADVERKTTRNHRPPPPPGNAGLRAASGRILRGTASLWRGRENDSQAPGGCDHEQKRPWGTVSEPHLMACVRSQGHYSFLRSQRIALLGSLYLQRN